MDMQPQPPLNTRAVLSFLLAVLTVISFCIGVAPIPLTALVCYPAAILLGLASLWMGSTALREVRQKDERGRRMALVGMWSGGLVMLAVLVFVVISALLFPYFLDYLRQVWEQLRVS
jgi:MFS family permease